MGYIDKTQEKRWYCIKDETSNIHLFGNVDLGNILTTGQPVLLVYLTEDELEIYVDSVLGTNYYKDAVESASNMFMGTSQKYPMPALV
jgi:hypothetical protein